MIKVVRLDERLIHGQIAIKWSKHLGVDRIVVVSDEAAASSMVQKSLLMAAPATVKVAIKSVEDAIGLLNDKRVAQVSILVIVSTPKDLLRLVNEVAGIPLINIGNYGRIAPRQSNEPRKSYRANLYAYPAEVEELRQVYRSGIECIYQTTPEDPPEYVQSILNF